MKARANRFSRGLFMPLLLGLVGIAAGISLGILSLDTKSNQPPATATSQSTAAPLDIRVGKFIYYDQMGGYFKAPKNMQYVTIQLTIKNNSSKSIDLAPSIQTHITSSANKRYGAVIFMIRGPFRGGPLAPGETRQGELAYAVPKNDNNLIFHFNDEALNVDFQHQLDRSQASPMPQMHPPEHSRPSREGRQPY